MSPLQLIMYLAIPYIFSLSLFLVRTRPTYSKSHGADVKIAILDEFPKVGQTTNRPWMTQAPVLHDQRQI